MPTIEQALDTFSTAVNHLILDMHQKAEALSADRQAETDEIARELEAWLADFVAQFHTIISR